MLKGSSALVFSLLIFMIYACKDQGEKQNVNSGSSQEIISDSLAKEVVHETLRSWNAYKKYAWGHDVLAPMTRSYRDWYSEPLYISPIDAYSSLFLMGLIDEAREIEHYVVDSLDFNKDIDAKVFEVNIRILGGLLCMYELSGNEGVLVKARDFADRMLPAFHTQTGIPRYWVNLATGSSRGDTVNVAEAATYTMEMGILSDYTGDPVYYQAGKKATLAIFERRSKLGLIGDVINVQTGEWVSRQSHICAGVDSYYEYLFKSFLLFGDPELGDIWDESIGPVKQYLPDSFNQQYWYARVDMDSGQRVSSIVTLYDAFFPALLALSGDLTNAAAFQKTRDWLWHQYGLEPMVYDYRRDNPNYPAYDLNPEIMESAWYLYHFTRDSLYFNMNKRYWEDLKTHCRTKIAFTSIENVQNMEQKDYMPTFFFAETLKYLYLTFKGSSAGISPESHVFNTEAHPFRIQYFDPDLIPVRLGIPKTVRSKS